MGLEVGGCSLFADPSGYVGRIVISKDDLLEHVADPSRVRTGLLVPPEEAGAEVI